MTSPAPPPVPDEPAADTRPRVFPCAQCGADLEFAIDVQNLRCPFCQHVQVIADPGEQVAEQDFAAVLARLQSQRQERAEPDQDLNEVTCEGCGGKVRFTGTLTSTECAWCGAPLQRAGVHEGNADRLPVDGMLAFAVPQEKAAGALRAWIRSRWFLPGDLKQRGIQDRFQGIYLPYWTFDALTANRYQGERGEVYTVTVGSGKNRRTETRVRWYPASGSFRRFFDDVLVVAGQGLPDHLLDRLEPWPLDRLQGFRPEWMAGTLARTYDVPLADGFRTARGRMEQAIEVDVRGRIGGDRQRIHRIDTHWGALTFKHVLLPTWLLSYRYRDKTYPLVVNGVTGEVQGDRPWAWLKILLLVLLAGAAIAAAVVLAQR